MDWTGPSATEVTIPDIGLTLTVKAISNSLAVSLGVNSDFCCNASLGGACGSCGACAVNAADTCQLGPLTSGAVVTSDHACSLAVNTSATETELRDSMACAKPNSTQNLFASMATDAMNLTTFSLPVSYYLSELNSGNGMCFKSSSALVRYFMEFTTGKSMQWSSDCFAKSGSLVS